MNEEAAALFSRAHQSLATAEMLLDHDPDASVSRSYYAAFYAVAALLSHEGSQFRRHTAVEAAVHRDLVKPGRWPPEAGAAYSRLLTLRSTADYGGAIQMSRQDAVLALEDARQIFQQVQKMEGFSG